MLIKELAPEERPRERLLKYGADVLSDSELLAILLRTGTKDMSVLAIASELVSRDEKGLAGIAECIPQELASCKGIGMAKACQIAAAVEIGKRLATRPREKRIAVTDSLALSRIFMEDMRYYKKEFMKVLLLNAKGEIISIESVAVGDLCSTVIHPREVFQFAVRKGAAAIALVHNHPSGDPTPSKADIDITKRLVESGKILGIMVVDHIIIGDGIYVSFRDKNLM